MSRRGHQFALLFFPELVATEIFRDDLFPNLTDGRLKPEHKGTFETVLWEQKKKQPLIPVVGKILEISTKTHLQALGAKEDGTLTRNKEERVYTTRNQAIRATNKQIKNARSDHTDILDQQIVENGPGAVNVGAGHKRTLRKEKQQKVSRAEVVVLQEKIDSLPCFQPPPPGQEKFYVQLSENVDVYMPTIHARVLQLCYKKQPVSMFREIIRCLVDEEILRHPGLSPLGGKGHASLSKEFITVASAWANKNSVGDKTYDPFESAGRLIYEERYKDPTIKRKTLFRPPPRETAVALNEPPATVQEGEPQDSQDDITFDDVTQNIDKANTPFSTIHPNSPPSLPPSTPPPSTPPPSTPPPSTPPPSTPPPSTLPPSTLPPSTPPPSTPHQYTHLPSTPPPSTQPEPHPLFCLTPKITLPIIGPGSPPWRGTITSDDVTLTPLDKFSTYERQMSYNDF